MEEKGALGVFLELVAAGELALCAGLSVVLFQRWRRSPSTATSSALGVFAVVAVVLASSYVQPDDPTSGWGAVFSDVLICVLLSIPYLLVRFTHALGGLGRRVHAAMAAVLAAEVLVTLVLPPLPADGEAHPRWFGSYLVLVLGAWTVQCLAAAIGLWRAGRGQSAIVRHRMRSLSTGGVLLAVTLVVSGSAGEGSPAALRVGTTLLGLAAIVLFAVAFLPPTPLRVLWRQADLVALSTAERGLMRAVTHDEVADTIVPVLGAVFAGSGSALLDRDAVPVRTTGLSVEEAAGLTVLLAERPGSADVERVSDDVLASRLTDGWLVVRAGRLAPVFGDDEAVLLSRVATLVDLALQRVALFEQERGSREAAEAANAELETLLYSVSHDLRSPLISVLGYLDVLKQEHGEQLTGDGPHYLERITVNAVYMQSLISDLLELSRIGRSDPPADRLELHALVEQVLEGARMAHPAADLRVEGSLPVVRMSDVRARQLVTNLVDNALKHGGREDLSIVVRSALRPSGELVLSVADDGKGVPEEYRSRVLRVFERLDAPKSSPGTGMGLAICKRITESLGGSILVGGPPEGAATGTTVSIELPASSVVSVPVPAPRGATSPSDRTTLEEIA